MAAAKRCACQRISASGTGGAGAPPRPCRLLEPMDRNIADVREIFAEIDRLGGAGFVPEGRAEQSPMPPPRDVSFDP